MRAIHRETPEERPRDAADEADDAASVLTDIGQTPTCDVHARVEPAPGDGHGRGQLFDWPLGLRGRPA
jgi:hypothetical protein